MGDFYKRVNDKLEVVIFIYINLCEWINKVKSTMDNYICSDCVKDSNLKRYIVDHGGDEVCNMCGKHSEHAVRIDTREFQNRMKAAIRYHYSEMLYNSHWGGSSNWMSLLEEENLIFRILIKEPKKFDVKSLYWEIDNIPSHIQDYSTDVSLCFDGERLDAFFTRF